MGALFQMGQFTGATTGTLQGMDYTIDLNTIAVALGTLNQSLNALTLALDSTMLGVTASTVPGTLANSAKGATIAFQSMAGINVDGNQKQANGLAALGVIAKQLAGLSSTMAAGVATNQIIAADQIKKNAFDKEATQAALTRNKLPTVTVTSQSFLQTIQSTVQDATAIASQASVTGLVTSTAAKAINEASNYVVDLLPSFGDITNHFKSLEFGKLADAEGSAVRVNGLALNTTSKAVTGTASA